MWKRKTTGKSVALVRSDFFSSGMADHALMLGSYMRRSCDQENHGHRWSHETWQIIKPKHKPPKQKARRRSLSQICVPPSKGQQSKGARAQQKQPQKRFAKDTVVKTHCVATDSKTCSKRISSHPIKWDTRSTLLPRRQQKVAFAIHYRLTQPLRVLSQVLVHVPMFRRAGTTKRQLEQEKDVGGQVSSCPSPLTLVRSEFVEPRFKDYSAPSWGRSARGISCWFRMQGAEDLHRWLCEGLRSYR